MDRRALLTRALQSVFVVVLAGGDPRRRRRRARYGAQSKKFETENQGKKGHQERDEEAKRAPAKNARAKKAAVKKPVKAKKAKQLKKVKKAKSVAKPTAVVLEGALEMPIFGVEVMK